MIGWVEMARDAGKRLGGPPPEQGEIGRRRTGSGLQLVAFRHWKVELVSSTSDEATCHWLLGCQAMAALDTLPLRALDTPALDSGKTKDPALDGAGPSYERKLCLRM